MIIKCVQTNSRYGFDYCNHNCKGECTSKRNSSNLPELAQFHKYPSLVKIRAEKPCILIGFDSEWQNVAIVRNKIKKNILTMTSKDVSVFLSNRGWMIWVVAVYYGEVDQKDSLSFRRGFKSRRKQQRRPFYCFNRAVFFCNKGNDSRKKLKISYYIRQPKLNGDKAFITKLPLCSFKNST